MMPVSALIEGERQLHLQRPEPAPELDGRRAHRDLQLQRQWASEQRN